ncbi:MAG: hypothetical protein Q3982_04375 [Phoenicibacter congonensis]|uniref:Uncharacterized protein n=1 Tax=Phoenicibacter congonensis TaxID=1944646 RepID=A0AA43RI25_9ACTN|nr:hypothetical protein [Phoenicibacter congonensis]
MYGLTFDLDANLLQDDYQITRPKAYSVIDKTLTDLGFARIQCNFYVLQNPKNGMNFLFDMNDELGKYEWFNACVHDIAAFKLEDWSDITESFKRKL